MYFRNYRLSNTWLDRSLRSAVSEYPLRNNMLKGPKHLWNPFESTFIIVSSSLRGEMIWKIYLLLKFEILGVLVNTLTTDDKYPYQDCENLFFPIRIQLS